VLVTKLTNQLTPFSAVSLEKLVVTQPSKNALDFNETESSEVPFSKSFKVPNIYICFM
jgi:hypothetical protein